MAKVDRDNIFELALGHKDIMLKRHDYKAFFLDCYEGEFIDMSLQKASESIFWYKAISLES